MPNYNQESKNKVHELMLTGAIKALTSSSGSKALIKHDELRVTFDHFLSLIERAHKSPSRVKQLRLEAERELAEWLEFDTAINLRRRASELKVLYLCGPSPTNDLSVLLGHGINIHNVWAVSGRRAFGETPAMIRVITPKHERTALPEK